jgi:hypothetical protein
LTQTTRPARPALLQRPRPAPARVAAARDLPPRLFAAGVAVCTIGVAAFLSHAVTAWNPHEDEVLALFAGRGSLGDLYQTVFRRGGAPLHYTIAWVVAHTGGGLLGLRIVSAIFAVLAVPLVALLGARLAGRATSLLAVVLMCGSWTLLFHGVYARMYSLFLVTSALSYLALLRAMEKRGKRDWAFWAVAILATAATHTYGAIVLASQGAYYLLVRAPLRRAIVPAAVVLVLGIPLWYSDVVLAGRYDIGVGAGGSKLDGPVDVFRYFFHVAGNFTAGWPWAVWPVLAGWAVGGIVLARSRPRTALLAGSVFATPLVVFLAAKVGSHASPETRHMIFALPFCRLLLAAGIRRVFRLPVLVVAVVAVLVWGEVAWGVKRNPEIYGDEPPIREAARNAASAWLAGTMRPDDVLLGYDPLFLGAWEKGGDVSRTVVPRADFKLALDVLRKAPKPLGRAYFVFDASDTNNWRRRLYVPALVPPEGGFEAQAFGPFLVLRTTGPTRTVRGFLVRAEQAELVGKSIYAGDADVNYDTVHRALEALH